MAQPSTAEAALAARDDLEDFEDNRRALFGGASRFSGV